MFRGKDVICPTLAPPGRCAALKYYMCVCVCVCVRVCVRACVRARVRACVCDQALVADPRSAPGCN